jgi:hypothetical protein
MHKYLYENIRSYQTIQPINPVAPVASTKPVTPITPAKEKINALQTQKDKASAALKNEEQSQQRTRAVTGLQKAQQTLTKVGLS